MTIPAELRALLAQHGERYHPRYQGFLSDHAPMALLALQQLGAEDSAGRAWYEDYVAKLEPASAAYLSRRATYLQQLRQRGAAAVLDQTLPELISGWAKDAYHPIIRLAYGFEAECLEEVASALAYFEMAGPEPQIDRLSATARHEPEGTAEALTSHASRLTPAPDSTATFTEKLSMIVAATDFAQAAFTLDDNLRQISALGLRVFASSHDFFALHLVTGAHAYRLLYKHAGPRRDAIFSLGFAAGYAAAGAPPLKLQDTQTGATGSSSSADATIDWLQLISNDEHDIKLAASAQAQGRYFRDPTYLNTAVDYLRRAD
jgi:hypothetical protein